MVPDPKFSSPYGDINQPSNTDADGADLAGATVIYESFIGNAYYQTQAQWIATGQSSGGISTPNLTIALAGDSRSHSFQISNTGSVPVNYISIYIDEVKTRAVFDISQLGFGSTTDTTNGNLLYGEAAYINSNVPYGTTPPYTPFYLEITIALDRPGLSPGANATFFASADFVAPEPGPAVLILGGLAALAGIVRKRRPSQVR
jgi:hypothetical protein